MRRFGLLVLVLVLIFNWHRIGTRQAGYGDLGQARGMVTNIVKKKKITKIGDKLNFLFDFISEFSKEYNIIKTIGKNYKYNNHFFNNEKINSTKPGTSSKVIYNAKEINCIKNIGRVIEDE